MTKYTEMTAPQMLEACADDAMKWAEAFCERFPTVPVDEAFGWFANAIENSGDVRFSRLVHDEQAWADFRLRVHDTRDLYREIAAMPAIEATVQ